MLVTGKEPQSIAHNRPAQIRRHIAIPNPLIAALRVAGGGIRKHRWLTRQRGRLPVVRRVVQEAVAALARNHVDDGTLHVAELGRCTDALHLYFLDEINARFGPRLAAAWAGEIRTVDEKHVLIRAGTKRRNAVSRHTAGRRRRYTGGRPDEIE